MPNLMQRICWRLPVTDQALHRFHQGCSDEASRVEPFLPIGCRVHITTGPMQGLEGTVSAQYGEGARLLITVHLLQSGVSMEIDRYMVQRID